MIFFYKGINEEMRNCVPGKFQNHSGGVNIEKDEKKMNERKKLKMKGNCEEKRKVKRVTL